MMEQRLAAHLPMAMFTINAATGEVKVIHRATDWLNHLEFSPTDPNLLMFCHEGPWHKVDRIWTMHTDGSHITKVHTRTMAMEIFGHEFWGHDGKTIWYDLQTPRGEDFWLAGYNVETGERTRYHLQRDEWSIHFNVTRDGKLFCGDGGDPGQVAQGQERAVDLSLPSGSHQVPGRAQREGIRAARRAPRGEAGQYGEAQLPAGAECQLHAGPEVGRVPLQHVRRYVHLRGRGSESAMKLTVFLLAVIPEEKVAVIDLNTMSKLF